MLTAMRCHLVLLVALVAGVSADLPIHCLNSDVAGTWKFQQSHGEHEHWDMCGYNQPDNNALHFKKDNSEKFVPVSDFTVTLVQPNKLVDPTSGEVVGSWTMIYDEGFELSYHGLKYFAFSKYEPNPGTSLSSDEVSEYESFCDQTRIGWFNMAEAPTKGKKMTYGCYRGEKVKQETLLEDEGEYNVQIELKLKKARANRKEKAKHAALDAHAQPLAEVERKHQPLPMSMGRPMISLLDTSASDSLPFKADHALVDRINSDPQSLWKARVPDSFAGKTVGEVRTYLGRRKFSKPSLRLDDQTSDESLLVVTDETKKTDNDTSEDAEFPNEFDWRSHNGENYCSTVVDQGGCGSCYALATSSAMEARWRIKHNKPNNGDDTQKFSAQDVLSCSTMNQGCEGGYPYLVSKFVAEHGLIEEKKFGYKGSDAPKCSRNTDNKSTELFYGQGYHYVGGYYGACNEHAMMREIMHNGPVVIGFEAPDTLSYYESGVFTGPAASSEPNTPNSGLNKWEHTNHAVVAVGWGEETEFTGAKTKYWVMQNTWGSLWGDHGFFKIRRGTDECACESMAVAAEML